MPVIVTLNVKNICIIFTCVCLVFLVYNVGTMVHEYGFWVVFTAGDLQESCNKDVSWLHAGRPVIGILGPRGSGVLWLRDLIEQMTGIYTGSVLSDSGYNSFYADGKTKNVVAVMAHDINKLPNMQAGILIFRNMKQSVRSTYAEKHGPGAFLEAPLHAYYGKEWLSFALEGSQHWVQCYRQYLASSKPLLIISYDELDDPNQIQNLLLKLSNFLHVPIKQSALQCVVENSKSFRTRPKSLRSGFQPFSLLPMQELAKLRRSENFTETAIRRARSLYRPKIHV